jgi:hypothetical protein
MKKIHSILAFARFLWRGHPGNNEDGEIQAGG